MHENACAPAEMVGYTMIFWSGYTLHQHCKAYMATFFTCGGRPQVPLRAFSSGTNGHLSRTTEVPTVSWTASSHDRIQSP